MKVEIFVVLYFIGIINASIISLGSILLPQSFNSVSAIGSYSSTPNNGFALVAVESTPNTTLVLLENIDGQLSMLDSTSLGYGSGTKVFSLNANTAIVFADIGSMVEFNYFIEIQKVDNVISVSRHYLKFADNFFTVPQNSNSYFTSLSGNFYFYGTNTFFNGPFNVSVYKFNQDSFKLETVFENINSLIGLEKYVNTIQELFVLPDESAVIIYVKLYQSGLPSQVFYLSLQNSKIQQIELHSATFDIGLFMDKSNNGFVLGVDDSCGNITVQSINYNSLTLGNKITLTCSSTENIYGEPSSFYFANQNFLFIVGNSSSPIALGGGTKLMQIGYDDNGNVKEISSLVQPNIQSQGITSFVADDNFLYLGSYEIQDFTSKNPTVYQYAFD